MGQKQRVEWIDIAKGLGITLVSFGHLSNGDGQAVWLPALGGLIAAIYLFHMPLFYFLGGLTFSRRGGFKAFLVRKAKTLLIPYYIFSLYFIAKPLAVILIPSLSNTFHSSHDYGNAGRQVFNVLIMGDGLWFLMAFFVGELLMYGLTSLFRSHHPHGGVLLCGVLLIVLTFMNNGVAFPAIMLPFQIIKGCQVAGFMAVGYAVHDKLLAISRVQSIPPTVGLITVYVISAVASLYAGLPRHTLWAVNLIAAVAGAGGFSLLCTAIQHSSLLSRLGRDSLVFYAVNAISLNVAKLIMFRLAGIDATQWPFAGQLMMGIITTAFAMVVMAAVDAIVQRYLWWSIGKPRPILPPMRASSLG